MPSDVIDGFARLTRDEQLDWATAIALRSINDVLRQLDPEERDRVYVEFRAMDERQRRDLIKRTLDQTGTDLREFARLSPDAVTARALADARDGLAVENEALNRV